MSATSAPTTTEMVTEHPKGTQTPSPAPAATPTPQPIRAVREPRTTTQNYKAITGRELRRVAWQTAAIGAPLTGAWCAIMFAINAASPYTTEEHGIVGFLIITTIFGLGALWAGTTIAKGLLLERSDRMRQRAAARNNAGVIAWPRRAMYLNGDEAEVFRLATSAADALEATTDVPDAVLTATLALRQELADCFDDIYHLFKSGLDGGPAYEEAIAGARVVSHNLTQLHATNQQRVDACTRLERSRRRDEMLALTATATSVVDAERRTVEQVLSRTT